MTCQQYVRTRSCSLATVLTFLNFQSDKGGLQLVKLKTCGQAPSFENIFALQGSGCSLIGKVLETLVTSKHMQLSL